MFKYVRLIFGILVKENNIVVVKGLIIYWLEWVILIVGFYLKSKDEMKKSGFLFVMEYIDLCL